MSDNGIYTFVTKEPDAARRPDETLAEGTTVFYDDDGQPTTNPQVASAKVVVVDRPGYYVKSRVSGFDKGGFLNTRAMLYNDREYDRFDFRPVTKEGFDCYINFLQSKSVAWLQEAERLTRN